MDCSLPKLVLRCPECTLGTASPLSLLCPDACLSVASLSKRISEKFHGAPGTAKVPTYPEMCISSLVARQAKDPALFSPEILAAYPNSHACPQTPQAHTHPPHSASLGPSTAALYCASRVQVGVKGLFGVTSLL